MNSECVTTLESSENTNNTSNSENFSSNTLSPERSPKESKTRNSRLMRKPVVKKKIDFPTEGESSENAQQWNSQADSFVFTPNPDPETATFVDPSAISQEFCFGSPDNDKSAYPIQSDSPKSNSTPNIQQTPLSTVHTPSISNVPIVAKPERVKVLRVPRSEKQRFANGATNVNPSVNNNNNTASSPQLTGPTTPMFQAEDEDDHDMGSVKRSKRKKDQAFSSSVDQDDTFALIDSDLVEESPTTAAVATHHVHHSMPKNGRLKEEHLFIAKASEGASHLLKKASKPLRPRIREIHDHDEDSADEDDKKKRTIKKIIRRGNDDFGPYSRSSQILARRRKKKEQWEEKEREERDKIKDFWLSLTDQERRELVKL